MTTLKEAISNVGKIAQYRVNGLVFIVKIEEAKFAYGKARYLITPLSGENTIWVDESSLRNIEKSSS